MSKIPHPSGSTSDPTRYPSSQYSGCIPNQTGTFDRNQQVSLPTSQPAALWLHQRRGSTKWFTLGTVRFLGAQYFTSLRQTGDSRGNFDSIRGSDCCYKGE